MNPGATPGVSTAGRLRVEDTGAREGSLPDRSKQRLEQYLRPLGRMEPAPEKLAEDAASAASPGKLCAGFFRDEDPQQLNFLFAQCLVKKLGMPPFVVFNVYDFVQMHWKTHPEFSSYLYFESEAALAWGGYEEMDNKSTEDMSIDFAVRRKAAGKTTLVFLKRGKYRRLEEYLSDSADTKFGSGVDSGRAREKRRAL